MIFNIDNSLSPFLYPIHTQWKKDIKIFIFPSFFCYNKKGDKQKLWENRNTKGKTQHWTKSPFNLKDTKYSSTFYSFISIILSYLIHEYFLLILLPIPTTTTTNNNIKYQECAFLFIQYSAPSAPLPSLASLSYLIHTRRKTRKCQWLNFEILP